MPQITFEPENKTFEVKEKTKLLVTARQNNIEIRFGCGSGKCGLCGVLISGDGVLTDMSASEKYFLASMGLSTDGSVRLACQAKILKGDITIDIDFQNTYSP